MLSLILLAASLSLSVCATPVVVRDSFVTIPVAKRINTTTGTLKLVEHDRQRVRSLLAKASHSQLQSQTIVGSISATNQAVDYVVSVRHAYPASTYGMLTKIPHRSTLAALRQLVRGIRYRSQCIMS